MSGVARWFTSAEHVVGDADAGGGAAGVLVHDGQVDLLQHGREVLGGRVPRFLEITPSRHTAFIALEHQPVEHRNPPQIIIHITSNQLISP